MDNNILGLIRTRYHTLSPVQKRVADWILLNPNKVMLLSLSALANTCSTSETTIMRFLRKLDYDSYQVFRVMIAQEVASDPVATVYEEVKENDSIKEVKKKVINLTVSSIKDLDKILDEKQLNDFKEMLLHAKRIVFVGAGASSNIAADAYHKFLRIGLNVILCIDPHIMLIQSTHLDKNDVLVAISHSGESRETLDAAKEAKRKGARIAALTSYKLSSLSKIANVTLLSSSHEVAYRSDAMMSRIIQLIIIDIAYVLTVLALGPEAIDCVNKSRLAVAKNKV